MYVDCISELHGHMVKEELSRKIYKMTIKLHMHGTIPASLIPRLTDINFSTNTFIEKLGIGPSHETLNHFHTHTPLLNSV